ncbi:hypothetical protein C0992_013295 [Termitomyces sp. T32_za158]|nr:hypothetical protein C0992_013295 [Termitomyces sp. T32_za158]
MPAEDPANPAKRLCTHDENGPIMTQRQRDPSPLEETIDERDSRPTRALPKRNEPFLWPNAQDMTNLPKDEDENPTTHLTQQGPTPLTLPIPGAGTFTQAVFPRLVIPFE